MIRPATRADVPRIFEIRDSVNENRLTDPDTVTEADAVRFIDNGWLWVWEEEGDRATGFSAADMTDASIWALFVAPGHEGKGIGRALLGRACDALREAGHTVATLRVRQEITAPFGPRASRPHAAETAAIRASPLTAAGSIICRRTLSTDPDTRAERHYRAAGWTVAGKNVKGELVFRKAL